MWSATRALCNPLWSLSSYLSSTLIFSRTGVVRFHLNSLTHRLLQFLLRNVCYVVTLAVSYLVFAATNTACCSAFVLLGLAKSGILHATLADIRPRTPLISFCTVQLRILCSTRSLATLSLRKTSGLSPGELPGFWGSMVFHHTPIPRKRLGNNNSNSNRR